MDIHEAENNSSITQWLEYRLDKAGVVGSNPTGATKHCPLTLIGSAASLKKKWFSVRIRERVPNKYECLT